jgi:hypothetical protein
MFDEEYRRIRGAPYQQVFRRPYQLGVIRNETLHVVKASAEAGQGLWLKHGHDV